MKYVVRSAVSSLEFWCDAIDEEDAKQQALNAHRSWNYHELRATESDIGEPDRGPLLYDADPGL